MNIKKAPRFCIKRDAFNRKLRRMIRYTLLIEKFICDSSICCYYYTTLKLVCQYCIFFYFIHQLIYILRLFGLTQIQFFSQSLCNSLFLHFKYNPNSIFLSSKIQLNSIYNTFPFCTKYRIYRITILSKSHTIQRSMQSSYWEFILTGNSYFYASAR